MAEKWGNVVDDVNKFFTVILPKGAETAKKFLIGLGKTAGIILLYVLMAPFFVAFATIEFAGKLVDKMFTTLSNFMGKNVIEQFHIIFKETAESPSFKDIMNAASDKARYGDKRAQAQPAMVGENRYIMSYERFKRLK